MTMTTENLVNEESKTVAKKKSTTKTSSKMTKAKADAFDPKMRNAPAKASRTVKNVVKEIEETVYVTANLLNVRLEPTTTSEIVRVVEKHEELELVAHVYGFGKLKDGTGYVQLDYTHPLSTCDGQVCGV